MHSSPAYSGKGSDDRRGWSSIVQAQLVDGPLIKKDEVTPVQLDACRGRILSRPVVVAAFAVFTGR
jgi:hypothetical protein